MCAKQQLELALCDISYVMSQCVPGSGGWTALGATMPRGADLAVVSAALSNVRELQEQAASQQQRCTPRHESDPTR